MQRRSSFRDRTRVLLQAVKEEDLSTVTNLCKAKADINCQDAFGNTPLMLAADRGATEIAEELIEHKAKLNLQDKYGQNALMYAAFEGQYHIVKALVEARARVNDQSHHGQTALMKAAYGNSIHIVTFLVAHKANVELATPEGRKVVHIAADNNKLNVTTFLVESVGTDKNAQDNEGNTPIMLAARKEHFLIVEYLASVDADLTIKNKYGQTLFDIPPLDGKVKLAEHQHAVEKAVQRGQAAKEEGRKIARAPSLLSIMTRSDTRDVISRTSTKDSINVESKEEVKTQ